MYPKLEPIIRLVMITQVKILDSRKDDSVFNEGVTLPLRTICSVHDPDHTIVCVWR